MPPTLRRRLHAEAVRRGRGAARHAAGGDCLYLNVWTPATAARHRCGDGVDLRRRLRERRRSPAVYDGSAFARRGIVFVSMNYAWALRLLRASGLTPRRRRGRRSATTASSQLAALQWVKRNARRSAGLSNVTIFGESAGGGLVNALMISPMAKGLFHKAIVQSGGGRSRGRSRCGTSASPALADRRRRKRWVWPSRQGGREGRGRRGAEGAARAAAGRHRQRHEPDGLAADTYSGG